MDGVGAAPPAIDVFAALRLTLAGPVALEAAVHVPAASWSFALSASSQHRMCFTLARQPSFFGRRRANQQHSASVYDPIKGARMALRSYY
jgi:hypothetical protein